MEKRFELKNLRKVKNTGFNIALTNGVLRLKVHVICIKELKESIIHRIAELSDFYHARNKEAITFSA